MACRGMYFALTKEEELQLLGASGDDEVLAVIEEIEESWDEEWLLQVDKAWDAMHRCLTDGTLSCEPKSAIHKCVLGGRQLYGSDDYIVSYASADDVKAIEAAIKNLDEAWMRMKYDQIDKNDYYPVQWESSQQRRSWFDEDCQYTWSYFEAVKIFYERAATHHRAMVFTADQ